MEEKKSNFRNSTVSAEKLLDYNCIKKFLNDGLDRLKISLILPKILTNPFEVKVSLKDTPFENTYSIIKNYKIQQKEKNRKLGNKMINQLGIHRMSVMETEIDVETIRLIDYFNQNIKMLEHLPNWVEHLNDSDDSLVKALELLIQVADEHLKLTALDKLALEKHMHSLHQQNVEIRSTLKKTQEKINEIKKKDRLESLVSHTLIKSYITELNKNNVEKQHIVHREMAKLNRTMRNINQASVIKQRELEEELETVTLELQKQADIDFKSEKIAREEKNKYEIQLQALLNKYDTTISEKFRDNLYLTDQYESARKEHDEFMVTYRSEEELYDRIVLSRIRQERAELMAKVEFFMISRAVLRIQRWVRDIWKATGNPVLQKTGRKKRSKANSKKKPKNKKK